MLLFQIRTLPDTRNPWTVKFFSLTFLTSPFNSHFWYVSFAIQPITREERVVNASSEIFAGLDDRQKDFLAFVLSKYIETGVGELDQDKLPSLLELKYHSIPDATEAFGDVASIKNTFIEFQKHLYQIKEAA